MKFCIVFEVHPETPDFDEEWTLVDCNIPRKLREPSSRGARGYERWDAAGGWAWQSFGGDLPGSFWDEGEVPDDVRAGGTFVALMEGRTYSCNSPLDPVEYDAELELLSYRKIRDSKE